ncbi:hypothetical protein EKO04_004289 [Ascochyta lentis]|uniref:DUF985 domain-containing protein n=1 Tax=Ascochyta lentis TaxID=205686 RepID=A0A8H7J987_9PLEO|nr:hypothetical protein EKO04_004289 [Ascochyta lentis]
MPSNKLTPSFPLGTHNAETPTTSRLINDLSLIPHPEGGYFVELDRDERRVKNPFSATTTTTTTADEKKNANEEKNEDEVKERNASTSILYFLTPHRPQGSFHRNKARTVHTLIRGRGTYVLLHPDEGEGGKRRVESFVVGHDVAAGEKVVWVVEGGRYKASFLLPDRRQDGEDGGGEESCLLISETVVPGFEFSDHDFLTKQKFEEILSSEQRDELAWLVRDE